MLIDPRSQSPICGWPRIRGRVDRGDQVDVAHVRREQTGERHGGAEHAPGDQREADA